MNLKADSTPYTICQKVLDDTYLLKCKDAFSDSTLNILNLATKRANCTLEYAIPAMVSTIGLLMDKADFTTINSATVPIFFTALAGQPSTGKSHSMNVFRNAFDQLETYYQILAEDSQQSNAGTVEALLDLHTKIPCLIGYYDEANTLFGSLGRYTQGGAAYDKSIYNNMWNGPRTIKRDLKSGRSTIVGARSQLTVCTHPQFVMNSLLAEKGSYDDGYWHRFVVIAPQPAQYSAREIRTCPAPTVSIQSILVFIKELHAVQRHYSIDIQHVEIVENIFDLYSNLVRWANKHESYLGGHIGKHYTMFERCCAVLQALETACDTLIDVPGAGSPIILPSFVEKVKDIVKNISEETFIIPPRVLYKAKNMNDYFNMNKLLLARYNIDPKQTYDGNLDKLLTDYTNKATTTNASIGITEEQNKTMRCIMTYKSTRVIPSKISHGNFETQFALDCMGLLAELGLGVLATEQTKNNRQCQCFYKVSSTTLQNDPKLGQTVQNLGLSVAQLIEQLKSQEELDMSILNATNNETNQLIQNNRTPLDHEMIRKSSKFKLTSTSIKNSTIHNHFDKSIQILEDSVNESPKQISNKTGQTKRLSKEDAVKAIEIQNNEKVFKKGVSDSGCESSVISHKKNVKSKSNPPTLKIVCYQSSSDSECESHSSRQSIIHPGLNHDSINVISKILRKSQNNKEVDIEDISSDDSYNKIGIYESKTTVVPPTSESSESSSSSAGEEARNHKKKKKLCKNKRPHQDNSSSESSDGEIYDNKRNKKSKQGDNGRILKTVTNIQPNANKSIIDSAMSDKSTKRGRKPGSKNKQKSSKLNVDFETPIQSGQNKLNKLRIPTPNSTASIPTQTQLPTKRCRKSSVNSENEKSSNYRRSKVKGSDSKPPVKPKAHKATSSKVCESNREIESGKNKKKTNQKLLPHAEEAEYLNEDDL